MKNNFDVNTTPVIAIWETTQSCDVPCLDYGDWIQPETDPLELSTEEAQKLIDEVAELCPPIFIMTGADPLKRADIYQLVRHAAVRGLHPFLALPATPLLTPDALAELKHAGLSRLILSLDAASPELHDLICGVHGSFARTMDAIQWAEQWKLPYQITTHLCERNLHELENLAALLTTLRIKQWSVAFPSLRHRHSWKRRLPPVNLRALLRGSTRWRKRCPSRSRLLKPRTIADMSCSSRPGKGPSGGRAAVQGGNSRHPAGE